MNIVINPSDWTQTDITCLYMDEGVHYSDAEDIQTLMVEYNVYPSKSKAMQAGRKGDIPTGRHFNRYEEHTMAYYVDVRGLSEQQLKAIEDVLESKGYDVKLNQQIGGHTLGVYGEIFGDVLVQKKASQYLRGIPSAWALNKSDTAASPQQLLEKLAPDWATGLGTEADYDRHWWYSNDRWETLCGAVGGTSKISIEILKKYSLFTFNQPKPSRVEVSNTVHARIGDTQRPEATLKQLNELLEQTGGNFSITTDPCDGERKILLEFDENLHRVGSLENAVEALKRYKVFLEIVEVAE